MTIDVEELSEYIKAGKAEELVDGKWVPMTDLEEIAFKMKCETEGTPQHAANQEFLKKLEANAE